MKNTITKLSLILLALGLSSTLNAASTDGDAIKGASVLANNCARCHNLRAIDELSLSSWKFSIQHMKVRANLTGQEARDVLAFIADAKK